MEPAIRERLMNYRESRNRRAFARAQAAWDNMTPDDDPTGPDCPECGAEMEWAGDEWRCPDCSKGDAPDDEPEDEPGESQSEMEERKP